MYHDPPVKPLPPYVPRVSDQPLSEHERAEHDVLSRRLAEEAAHYERGFPVAGHDFKREHEEREHRSSSRNDEPQRTFAICPPSRKAVCVSMPDMIEPRTGALAPLGQVRLLKDRGSRGRTVRLLDLIHMVLHVAAVALFGHAQHHGQLGAGVGAFMMVPGAERHNVGNGAIVLALLDGEFTIKRYRKTKVGIVLHAENKAFADIEVPEDCTFEVWGVVKNTIRML